MHTSNQIHCRENSAQTWHESRINTEKERDRGSAGEERERERERDRQTERETGREREPGVERERKREIERASNLLWSAMVMRLFASFEWW